MISYQETSSEKFAEELPLLRAVTKQRLVKADLEDPVWNDFKCGNQQQCNNYLYVVTICKWSINLLTNTNPVSSH
jgi:hypothetical protein